MPYIWEASGGDTGKLRSTEPGKAGKAGAMEARLDSALLVCEAMWTLLRDKVGVTDEDLIKRINDLDLSDGKLDGKVRKPPVSCPKCQRTIARRMPKCMYCGQPIMHDPFA